MAPKKGMTTYFFHSCLSLLILDPGSEIRDKHPGSATLISTSGTPRPARSTMGLQRYIVYLGWTIAPLRIWAQMRGGGVTQINFGDLTPYLTYAFNIVNSCLTHQCSPMVNLLAAVCPPVSNSGLKSPSCFIFAHASPTPGKEHCLRKSRYCCFSGRWASKERVICGKTIPQVLILT